MAKILGTITGVILLIISCIFLYLLSKDIRDKQLPVELRGQILKLNKYLPADVYGGGTINKIRIDGMNVTYSITLSENPDEKQLELFRNSIDILACTYRFNRAFLDASEKVIISWEVLQGNGKTFVYSNTNEQCIENSLIYDTETNSISSPNGSI